jgi:hypothetical protein
VPEAVQSVLTRSVPGLAAAVVVGSGTEVVATGFGAEVGLTPAATRVVEGSGSVATGVTGDAELTEVARVVNDNVEAAVAGGAELTTDGEVVAVDADEPLHAPISSGKSVMHATAILGSICISMAADSCCVRAASATGSRLHACPPWST